MYIKAEGSVQRVVLALRARFAGELHTPGLPAGTRQPWFPEMSLPVAGEREEGDRSNRARWGDDRRVQVTDSLKPRVCCVQGGCAEGRLVAYRLLSRCP